jgi:2-dehydropantoate 2-reductase
MGVIRAPCQKGLPILSMRIGIVGLGAIGGWIAARLALAGHPVSALARGSTLHALSAGLRIRDADGNRLAQIEASSEPCELGHQDVLVIGVKAPALAAAAELARPMIGANTLILPMLNGVPWWFVPGDPLRSVDPDGRIAANLPQDRVVGCVVHAACRRTGPAEVEVVHADRLILGEPKGGPSERVERLAALFEGAGIRAEKSDDVRRAIWYKLWGNATINPLSALTRATADRLLAEPHLRAFMLQAMVELASIGAAVGCPIGESGEDRMAVTARLGSFKTSMLQDVESGRPIELEALLGAPREIARRRGISTPRLDLLYAEARLLGESLNLL